MANKTVYPYGTGGQLPSSVGIVNDLVTGGSDKALSAQQGVVIGEYLFDRYVPFDTSSLTVENYGLSTSSWTSKGRHCVIPISPGDKLKVAVLTVDTGTTGAWYGFFTSAYVPPASTSSAPPYCSGTNRVMLNLTDGVVDLTAPSDAAYFCFCPRDGSGYWSTWSIAILDKADITNDFIEKDAIVNDLVTGGADVPLSAQQGVVMKSITDELDERKIDKMQGVETAIDLEFYSSVYISYYINAGSNTWAGSTATTSFFVPIRPKHTYRVTANATNQSRIAILTNMEHSTGTTPSYATGESALHFINAGQTYTFTAPTNAHYLNCNYSLSNISTVIKPSAIVEIFESE